MLPVLLFPLSKQACEDRQSDCRFWAFEGECQRNWEWMSVHCPLSCGICIGGHCADTDASCAVWANNSECSNNSRFMIDRCPASCDVCPGLRPSALPCDACLALQEATWRHLALTYSDGAEEKDDPDRSQGSTALPDGQVGSMALHAEHSPTRLAVRLALRDVCASHEWMMLGTSLGYHTWCEQTVSAQLDLLTASWANLLASSDIALVDRATVLRQKTALCVGAVPTGLGVCGPREVDLFHLGAATDAGACNACRNFVRDAVVLIRRSDLSPRDMNSPDYRRLARHIDDICEDLDMRHFASKGTPASGLYEDCLELLRGSYDVLVKLVFQWTYKAVEHYVCTRMLVLCAEEEAAEVSATNASQPFRPRTIFSASRAGSKKLKGFPSIEESPASKAAEALMRAREL